MIKRSNAAADPQSVGAQVWNDTSPLSNVYRADSKTRSTCNAGDRRVPGHDRGVYANETIPKSQTQQPAVTSQASPAVDASNVMAYRSARAMVSDTLILMLAILLLINCRNLIVYRCA
jgi:hypothetical protein